MMLENHTNAIEKVLPAQSLTARNAGHPNLRGCLKSALHRTFLTTKDTKGAQRPQSLNPGHKAQTCTFGRICLRAGAGASPESVIIRIILQT